MKITLVMKDRYGTVSIVHASPKGNKPDIEKVFRDYVGSHPAFVDEDPDYMPQLVGALKGHVEWIES